MAVVPGGPYSADWLAVEGGITDVVVARGYVIFAPATGGLLLSPADDYNHQSRVPEGHYHGLKVSGNRVFAIRGTSAVQAFTIRDGVLEAGAVARMEAPVLDYAVTGDRVLVLQTNGLLGQYEWNATGFAKAAGTERLASDATTIVMADGSLIAGGDALYQYVPIGHGWQLRGRYPLAESPPTLLARGGRLFVPAGPAGLLVVEPTDEGIAWLASDAVRGAATHAATNDPDMADGSLIACFDGQDLVAMRLSDNGILLWEGLSRTRQRVNALAMAGGVLHAATSGGLERIDFRFPAVTQISREGLSHGGSRKGLLRDDQLLVADWFSGLHVYDVSDPRHITLTASLATPGSAKGIALRGDHVLVADDDHGLQVIDATDITSPRLVGNAATTGLAYNMQVRDHLVYLADHRGGLQIIDISSPSAPVRLGHYDTEGMAWAVDAVGTSVFVADDDRGLVVVDASNPRNPKPVARYEAGGRVEDVVVRGHLAYLLLFEGEFQIVDVAVPRAPVGIHRLSIPGHARGLHLEGDLAYVAAWDAGLVIVDVSTPRTPRLLAQLDTPGEAWGVVVRDQTAYVLDWWGGIQSVDVSRPEAPATLARYHETGEVDTIVAADDHLFLAKGPGGLHLYDNTNPSNPIWINGANRQRVDYLQADEGRLYLLSMDGQLEILNQSDPFRLERMGQQMLDPPVLGLAVRDRLLYVNQGKWIARIDVRDPGSTETLSPLPLAADGMAIDGNLLAATGEGWLRWYALSGNERPRLVASSPVARKARLLFFEDAMLGIVPSGNGHPPENPELQLWQVVGGRPSLTAVVRTAAAVLDAAVAGPRLMVLTAAALEVYRLATSGPPALEAYYPSTGSYSSMQASQTAATFGGEAALATLSLLPAAAFSADGPEVSLRLAASMPTGVYHLYLRNGTEERIVPGAFHLRPTQSGPRLTPERYRELLNERRQRPPVRSPQAVPPGPRAGVPAP